MTTIRFSVWDRPTAMLFTGSIKMPVVPSVGAVVRAVKRGVGWSGKRTTVKTTQNGIYVYLYGEEGFAHVQD